MAEVESEAEGMAEVSFEGVHNKRKMLAFLALALASKQGLGLRWLAYYAGTSQHSLRALVARWARWGYVRRGYRADGVPLVYLGAKGADWANKHFYDAPLGEWWDSMSQIRQDYFKALYGRWLAYRKQRLDRQAEAARWG